MTLKDPREKCFVLMPFGNPFDRYYDAVYAAAITDVDLQPVRGDSLFRPSPIMSDVWQFVRQSTVLVADLTGRNPNVFYELGLAHAIGKPVVLVAETIEDVPFDLRGLRVITFDRTNPDWGVMLRDRIASALRETLSDVLGAVPTMFLRSTAPDPPGTKETSLELQIRALTEEITALRRERKPSIAEIVVSPAPATTVAEIQVLFHSLPKDNTVKTIQRALEKVLLTSPEVLIDSSFRRIFTLEKPVSVPVPTYDGVMLYIRELDGVSEIKALTL